MATVYLARARGPQQFVKAFAVKELHPHLREDADFVDGLMSEGAIAARLRHPNIVSVHEVVNDAGGLYLVMDYVEGDTISFWLRKYAGEHPMPTRIAMAILRDLLSALVATHELTDASGAGLNVVHRDVSPQNVLLGSDGVARLTDFGVARSLLVDTHTKTGVLKGKFAYMGPEQLRGAPVGSAVDLWAASVLGWELLAGRRMYGKIEEAQLVSKILFEDAIPLREIRPEVSSELEAWICRGLGRDPALRIATAREMLTKLREVARAEGGYADTDEIAEWWRPFVDVQVKRRDAILQGALPPDTIPSPDGLSSGRVSESNPSGPMAHDSGTSRPDTKADTAGMTQGLVLAPGSSPPSARPMGGSVSDAQLGMTPDGHLNLTQKTLHNPSPPKKAALGLGVLGLALASAAAAFFGLRDTTGPNGANIHGAPRQPPALGSASASAEDRAAAAATKPRPSATPPSTDPVADTQPSASAALRVRPGTSAAASGIFGKVPALASAKPTASATAPAPVDTRPKLSDEVY
jgi:eukaryotic-like serine/threonine-protein kinase